MVDFNVLHKQLMVMRTIVFLLTSGLCLLHYVPCVLAMTS
jgi:hypothetical protein